MKTSCKLSRHRRPSKVSHSPNKANDTPIRLKPLDASRVCHNYHAPRTLSRELLHVIVLRKLSIYFAIFNNHMVCYEEKEKLETYCLTCMEIFFLLNFVPS